MHCLSTTPRTTTATILLGVLLWYSPATALAWVDPAAGTPYPRAVSRPASIPEENWKPGHRGVDLALKLNAPVLAAGDGVVAFVGTVAGTPVISIDHPGGIRTTYQPVRSDLKAGDNVTEGHIIGRLARATSHFAGEHDGLHWGALTGPDKYIDPLTLLEPPRIRLKPVDAPGRRRF